MGYRSDHVEYARLNNTESDKQKGRKRHLAGYFNAIEKSLSTDERSNLIKQIRTQIEGQYQNHETTRKLVSRPIKQATNEGAGYLYTFVDDNLLNEKSLPEGESIYASAGVIIIDNVLITSTILTNNTKTENYVKALAALHFLTI